MSLLGVEAGVGNDQLGQQPQVARVQPGRDSDDYCNNNNNKTKNNSNVNYVNKNNNYNKNYYY